MNKAFIFFAKDSRLVATVCASFESEAKALLEIEYPEEYWVFLRVIESNSIFIEIR